MFLMKAIHFQLPGLWIQRSHITPDFQAQLMGNQRSLASTNSNTSNLTCVYDRLKFGQQHYKADMFTFTDQAGGNSCNHGECCSESSNVDRGNEFGLKPMNCPGHCIMFKSVTRSYRDLPLRYAEFSPLHRNEIAGSLSGLTRVRRFAQDDAHIFCGREHIETEIKQCLEMMRTIYNHVGFSYSLRLSTRPSSCVL